MPKKVTTFNIDSEILDAAKQHAADCKQSLSAYVQEAISNHNLMYRSLIEDDNEGGAIPCKQIPELPVFKVQ